MATRSRPKRHFGCHFLFRERAGRHFGCHFSVLGTGGAALWLSLLGHFVVHFRAGLAAQGSRAESWGERGQGAAVWDERGALLLSLFCSGNGRGGSSAPWGLLSYEKQCELHSKNKSLNEWRALLLSLFCSGNGRGGSSAPCDSP